VVCWVCGWENWISKCTLMCSNRLSRLYGGGRSWDGCRVSLCQIVESVSVIWRKRGICRGVFGVWMGK
jgi:hypothetical protein